MLRADRGPARPDDADRATWSEIGDNIRECVLDYLSVGIDPEKTTIYLQSLVPEVLELFWLFMPLVGVPRAQRIPTLKEQVRDLQLETASMALLSYPVLQSADILMVKGDVVPVGKDQASHVELTREIARRFNQTYGAGVPGAGRADHARAHRHRRAGQGRASRSAT